MAGSGTGSSDVWYVLKSDMLGALTRASDYLQPFLPKDRTGGFVCLLSLRAPHAPIMHAQFHAVDPLKREKYSRLSREKAVRLCENPEHLTSRQSADESRHRYPGAIRVLSQEYGDMILSFSGLPAAADEALMLLVALEMKWMDERLALQIAARSQDPDRYFEQANELRIKAAASA